MQRLEVSGAVRPLYGSLGFKGLILVVIVVVVVETNCILRGKIRTLYTMFKIFSIYNC